MFVLSREQSDQSVAVIRVKMMLFKINIEAVMVPIVPCTKYNQEGLNFTPPPPPMILLSLQAWSQKSRAILILIIKTSTTNEK